MAKFIEINIKDGYKETSTITINVESIEHFYEGREESHITVIDMGDTTIEAEIRYETLKAMLNKAGLFI